MKSQSALQITDPDTICHQWGKCAVIVNRASGLVEFRHCHGPGRSIFIFPKAQPNFACSISDLRAVHFTPQYTNHHKHHHKKHPGFLTVVTTTGKAYIEDTGTHFATLREWFNEAVPRNDPKFATDNPLLLWAYVLVGTVCLFTAAFLAEGAGTVAMCVAAVFGAIIGVVATFFAVQFGGRLLNTDITYGIYSILIGGPLIAAVGFSYVGGEGSSFLAILLLGLLPFSIWGAISFATMLLKRRTKP